MMTLRLVKTEIEPLDEKTSAEFCCLVSDLSALRDESGPDALRARANAMIEAGMVQILVSEGFGAVRRVPMRQLAHLRRKEVLAATLKVTA